MPPPAERVSQLTDEEEGWVVCRAFKKRVTAVRRPSEHESPCSWFDEQVSFIPELDSPKRMIIPSQPENIAAYHHHHQHHLYTCKPELELHYTNSMMPHDHSLFLQLAQLESPKLPAYINNQGNALEDAGHHQLQIISVNSVEQVTDWTVLDKFVASQLSQDVDDSREPNFQVSDKQEAVGEYASTSNSSCQIDLWK